MATCKLDFWNAFVSERSIASVQGLCHLMAQLKWINYTTYLKVWAPIKCCLFSDKLLWKK